MADDARSFRAVYERDAGESVWLVRVDEPSAAVALDCRFARCSGAISAGCGSPARQVGDVRRIPLVVVGDDNLEAESAKPFGGVE
jgi:hypothetical protein